LAQRAQVVMACAAGRSNSEIAARTPVVRAASALPRALHADQCVVTQSRRTLVRAPQTETDQVRRSPQRPRPQTAIREYVTITNNTPQPFVWTKTADEILAKVAAFRQRTSNSGHGRAAQINPRRSISRGSRASKSAGEWPIEM
jgi:hypothetical protein